MIFSLKNYSDLEKIGPVETGAVFSAVQRPLDRKVVLKKIVANPPAEPSLFHCIEREVTSAGTLDHPNIIHIYESGPDNGFFYISMEYIDGFSL